MTSLVGSFHLNYAADEPSCSCSCLELGTATRAARERAAGPPGSSSRLPARMGLSVGIRVDCGFLVVPRTGGTTQGLPHEGDSHRRGDRPSVVGGWLPDPIVWCREDRARPR